MHFIALHMYQLIGIQAITIQNSVCKYASFVPRLPDLFQRTSAEKRGTLVHEVTCATFRGEGWRMVIMAPESTKKEVSTRCVFFWA